jgi:hypothetical protein
MRLALWRARFGHDGLGQLHAEDRIGVGQGRQAHRVRRERLEAVGKGLRA